MSDALALQQPLVEVRLYGELGRTFGRSHRLAVSSVREAMVALSVVLPGFAEHLVGHAPGYKVFLGRKGRNPVGENRLEAPVSAREAICVVPVIAGAKSGFGQILLGTVLLIAAPYAAAALWSTGTAFGTAAAIAIAGSANKIAAALIIGGVVQLVAPQRQQQTQARPENLPSYTYDGVVNTSQVGLPVPLTYGRVFTGGAVVSSGISTEDFVPAAGAAAMPAQTLPAEQPLTPWTSPEYLAPG